MIFPTNTPSTIFSSFEELNVKNLLWKSFFVHRHSVFHILLSLGYWCCLSNSPGILGFGSSLSRLGRNLSGILGRNHGQFGQVRSILHIKNQIHRFLLRNQELRIDWTLIITFGCLSRGSKFTKCPRNFPIYDIIEHFPKTYSPSLTIFLSPMAYYEARTLSASDIFPNVQTGMVEVEESYYLRSVEEVVLDIIEKDCIRWSIKDDIKSYFPDAIVLSKSVVVRYS